ncbi:hypothetical protein PFLUV_G00011170 [Perca fluviatilis]|uniref:Uncharacterized protein n=1 Tax=Perca fluviatilis TaxID=8168 RepID=A0A6A5FRW8_PERFL|nr:hypothetical protein PFLUV_G00011170 [Perca fluviatilis]
MLRQPFSPVGGESGDEQTAVVEESVNGNSLTTDTLFALSGCVLPLLQRISTTRRNHRRGLLSFFISTFLSLPPSTSSASGSIGGSASLQKGTSAVLQITRCTPKHQQAFPEPFRSPSTDRKNQPLELDLK